MMVVYCNITLVLVTGFEEGIENKWTTDHRQ